ncbi:MAG: hypothetical protein R3F20_12995 [Planctomycetota bacterium]
MTGIGTLLLSIVLATSGPREIKPSFSVVVAAWNATHVVLADEGETFDGEMTVTTSLRGDLAPGATLRIPELAALAPVERRRTVPGWLPEREPPPTVVSGRRVLLFLVRTEEGWATANPPGGMRESACWFEGGRAFAFVQRINPGPVELIPWGPDEVEMWRDVFQALDWRDRFDAALAIEAPARRAEALAGMLHPPSEWWRGSALDALAAIGDPALPFLRREIEDLERAGAAVPPDLQSALVTVGGESVRPDLHAIFRRESAFWRTRAPELGREWFHGGAVPWPEQVRLRDRLRSLTAAIETLARLAPDAAMRESIRDFASFWRALPHLEGRTDGLLEACESHR